MALRSPDAIRQPLAPARERLLDAVQQDRLWREHMALAALGATPKGGVRRLALSEVDNAARLRLVAWARQRGHGVFTDPIGNVFVRREGTQADAAPVLTGSHLDSQPTGGRFDGPFGVLAGCEVLQALDDAGISTRRAIEVVSWANEEGCRFAPGCMGSSCYATPSLLPQWLACVDRDGVSVADALEQMSRVLSDVPVRPLGARPHAFIEAHIEQGPVLENAQATIGVVSGIQGCRDFRITVQGAEGHAGTTPILGRQDALRCAVALLDALYRLASACDPATRFTVGELNVMPNSSSVIPGQVNFAIDFRHPSQDALVEIGDRIAALCEQYAGPCEIAVQEVRWRQPIAFDQGLQDRVQSAAQRQGLGSVVLVSGASHDAAHLHRVCRSGMVFIPCAGGLSHNELESANARDIHRGTQVLAEVLLELANEAD